MNHFGHVSITPGKLRTEVLRMNQGRLAGLLGVSLRTLSRWESGKIPMSRMMQLATLARNHGHPVTAHSRNLWVALSSLTATAPAPATAPGSCLPAAPAPLETAAMPFSRLPGRLAVNCKA